MKRYADKYEMLNSIATRFGLDEDQTQDLVVYMLEHIGSNRHTYQSVYREAQRIRRAKELVELLPWEDVLCDVGWSGSSVFDRMLHREYAEVYVKEALEILTPREELALKMLYGLDGYYKRTHLEAADAFDVSEARIRQIEAKAFSKLRRHKSLRLHRLRGATE